MQSHFVERRGKAHLSRRSTYDASRRLPKNPTMPQLSPVGRKPTPRIMTRPHKRPIKGPGAESAREDSASHATPGPTPRIDLTTPDDGYINLRRRAARDSLVGGRKKLEIDRPAIAP